MKILNKAIDLLLPYKCDICGGFADTAGRIGRLESAYKVIYGSDPGFHICSRCLSGIVPQRPDRRWFTCLSNPVEDDPVSDLALFMPFAYSGVVDKAIPEIKFSGKIELARLLGILLGNVIKEEGVIFDVIVPVPLSEERMTERGYNQAYEIAYPVAWINGKAITEDMLIRKRNTGRQSRLSGTQARMMNVENAFAINGSWDLTGSKVLLLDDVATTGHTLRECALTVMRGGASEVLCCAFAGNRQLKNDEPF